MIYKYLFCYVFKAYKNLEGEDGVPGFSALLVVSALQSFTIMCLVHFAKSLLHLSFVVTKIQLFIPALSILLLNYIWLYKVNNIKDVFIQVENLSRSKSNFYTIAIILHFILTIFLFVLG